MSARVLVVAKAPVAGEAKTRLGRDIGMPAAADLAAAALLDTLAAARDAFAEGSRFVALTGDLALAARSEELSDELAHWQVFDQRGDGFAARLAAAYADLPGSGPVVQVGMDTPQVTAADLAAVASALEDADAVLGPAEDGGWWVLALRRPEDAVVLRDVPMSEPTTYDATWRALSERGLRVVSGAGLRDVDTAEDASIVADVHCSTRFAQAWAALADADRTVSGR